MGLAGRSTFGLAALVSGVLTVATLVTGALTYAVTHEAIEAQLDQRIYAETKDLLAEPGADRTAALVAAIGQRERAAGPDHLGYLLADAAGRRLAGSLDADAPEQPGYEEFLRHADDSTAQALTTALPDGGRLVVAADRATLYQTDRTLFTLIASGFGAMLALGLLGSWTLGAVTRARLTRIDQAAQVIIGGDMTQRMPIDGSKSEFDRLSATLNRMLDRISDLMTNLRQVSSDVAHDLRTPLTRLRNRLEEAASSPPPQKDAAVAAAIAQADELLEIFSALLRISEIEAMGVRRQFRRVALSEALGDLVESYRPDAEASGHALEADVAPDIHVDGDRRLLMQLASNLLDNALRHTPAGTRVRVVLARADSAVTLVVEDDGPGVAAEHLPRLFERFSRLEASRTSGGHGLGLALVAAIAAAHNGSVVARPAPGFAVKVWLAQAIAG
jgi:hypothetical protein